MNDILQLLLDNALEFVLVVALPFVLNWITTRASTWLQQQSEAADSAMLQALYGTLFEFVHTEVANINAMVVEQLKAAHEDGKLTKEEMLAIKRTVMERVWQALPSLAQDALLAFFSNKENIFTKILGPLVERIVTALKAGGEGVLSSEAAAKNVTERELELAKKRIGLL